MARRTAEAAGAAEALMRPGSGLRDLDALLRLRSRKTLGARSVRGGGEEGEAAGPAAKH